MKQCAKELGLEEGAPSPLIIISEIESMSVRAS